MRLTVWILILVLFTAVQPASGDTTEAFCFEWEHLLGVVGLPTDQAAIDCSELTVQLHDFPEWGLALLWKPENEAKPVLSLRRGVFAEKTGGIRSLIELPVDASELLFHELLKLRLQSMVNDKGGFTEEIQLRAEEAMSRVPAESRLEAYSNAVLSFGSHVLSLRAQIERAHRLKLSRGGSLCRQVRSEGPLLRLWNIAFGDGLFPGEYPVMSESGQVEGWITTRAVLSGEDKDWVLEILLSSAFVGQAQPDFESLYCSEVDSED